MSKHIFVNHSDYCPYLDEHHNIRVEYVEFTVIGNPGKYYKLLGYSCSHSAECPYPYQGTGGECSVFNSAPEEPY